MLTHQDKIIQKIFRQLNGIEKVEVYDILLKIESMLDDYKSPIDYKEVKKGIENTAIKTNIYEADSYGYCYLYDVCPHIKIYKVKTLFSTCLGGEYMYYITPWQLRLIDYNRDNLKITFQNTDLEAVIDDFLQRFNPEARNLVSGRLKLLELLDTIDPY